MIFKLPAIAGEMDWRILANWRVEPAALQPLLPEGFRPRLIDGYAIAGVCLIALKHARPTWLPRFMGMRSINAAHRVAVIWRDASGASRSGVMVLRRDTSSFINAATGGRIFPTYHHLSRFEVERTNDAPGDPGPESLRVRVRTRDGHGDLALAGEVAPAIPKDSVFADLDEACAFFESDRLGLSPRRRPAASGGGAQIACDCAALEGIELCIDTWRAQPFAIESCVSAIFGGMPSTSGAQAGRDAGDTSSAPRPLSLPASACTFDHALLMRDVPHQWRPVDRSAFTGAS